MTFPPLPQPKLVLEATVYNLHQQDEKNKQTKQTPVERPFVRDYPGEPVTEK